MQLQLFSLRDLKAKLWLAPSAYRSQQDATRALVLAVAREDSDLARYPEDYQLYHVGSFDDESGIFSPCPPAHVIDLISCKEAAIKDYGSLGGKRVQQQPAAA